jgi:hypothetical protein
MNHRFIKTARAAFALAMATVSLGTQAYETNEPAKAALSHLTSIDCSVQATECRYYAAVETVAFVHECPLALAQKFKDKVQPTPKLESALANWRALDSANLKTSVLSPDNKLRLGLERDTSKYLSKLSADELGIECSRIQTVLQNKLPEGESDILQGTKNYEAWRAQHAK